MNLQESLNLILQLADFARKHDSTIKSPGGGRDDWLPISIKKTADFGIDGAAECKKLLDAVSEFDFERLTEVAENSVTVSFQWQSYVFHNATSALSWLCESIKSRRAEIAIEMLSQIEHEREFELLKPNQLEGYKGFELQNRFLSQSAIFFPVRCYVGIQNLDLEELAQLAEQEIRELFKAKRNTTEISLLANTKAIQETRLANFETDTPRLNTQSVDWIAARKENEERLNLSVESLRKYRTSKEGGETSPCKMYGIDGYGRKWRRVGTPKSRVYYLASSLPKA
jgi:hypothetical protein